jgi:hypothetical protein
VCPVEHLPVGRVVPVTPAIGRLSEAEILPAARRRVNDEGVTAGKDSGRDSGLGLGTRDSGLGTRDWVSGLGLGILDQRLAIKD